MNIDLRSVISVGTTLTFHETGAFVQPVTVKTS